MLTKSEIYVDYEYGDLKEVIVGVPFMIYPDLDIADWVQRGLEIFPESEQKKIVERSGKTSIEIGKYDAMEAENQELINIFQNHGIKIWRPEVLSRERLATNLGENTIQYCGISFQYARDPIAVIGDNVIELNLGSLFRVADLLAYRQLFMDRVFGSNAKWFAMPKVDYSILFEGGRYNKHKFPMLEGGDILVLGKKILVGNSMNPVVGSNEFGYMWLKSILEPQGYDVERVPIKEMFLHLDGALSVVRPGLAIVCRDAFVNGILHISMAGS